jgi:cation diffusion facilitator CzcD-associated flavoprotein CzcO
MSQSPTAALQALQGRIAQELEYIGYPGKRWIPKTAGPDGKPVLDVLMVGAGQSGLSVAFALRQEKVERVLAIDRAPAGQQGPWVTYARMTTLRTPKHITGPDLGVPSLTPRAWYEARFGVESWRTLGRIPREHGMEYLNWYRRVLDLPVRNGATLTAFGPVEHGERSLLRAWLRSAHGDEAIYARKLVFANGIEGCGRWELPAIFDALPRSRYAHTSEAIAFEALRGRRIGVLGHGASAFDHAGTALEAGAAEVHLFYRRTQMPVVNPNRWMENTGVLAHWADMADEWKWRFMRHFCIASRRRKTRSSAAWPGRTSLCTRAPIGRRWLKPRTECVSPHRAARSSSTS